LSAGAILEFSPFNTRLAQLPKNYGFMEEINVCVKLQPETIKHSRNKINYSMRLTSLVKTIGKLCNELEKLIYSRERASV
jgi:hypothetical protein